MQPNTRSTLHTYVDQIEHKIEPVIKLVSLQEALEPVEPSANQPDPELEGALEPDQTPIAQPEADDDGDDLSSLQESFYSKLLERLEQISLPVMVQPSSAAAIVDTSHQDAQIEKLYEVEQSVVGVLTKLNERIDLVTEQATTTLNPLCEMLINQQAMITQINETQAHIINAVIALTEKIESLSVQPAPAINPVVNVPAPIVNVSVQEGKRVTKTIERDAHGLISKITEGYAFDNNAE